MQKKNRIMLKAVAILLSLVLITTCIVSSTFAKFVIQKSTKTEMTLEAYGIVLDLDVAQALKSACTVEEKVNGNSLTVNLTNLKFVPGDDFSDSIIFSFSGTATTRLRFNIDVDVDFDTADFTVPAGVGKLTEATCFFPLGFNRNFDYDNYGTLKQAFSGKETVVQKPWMPAAHYNNVSEDILYQLWGVEFISYKYDLPYLTVTGSNKDDGSKDISLEKIFEEGDDIHLSYWYDECFVNNLKFGFHLPYDIDPNEVGYDSSLDYSAIENYLLNKLSEENTDFSMSFTISVEQVSNSYTIPPMTWTEVE